MGGSRRSLDDPTPRAMEQYFNPHYCYVKGMKRQIMSPRHIAGQPVVTPIVLKMTDVYKNNQDKWGDCSMFGAKISIMGCFDLLLTW